MKYYIISGEASGDLHASNLIKAIKSKDKNAEIRAWGGDLMKDEGAVLVRHYRELAFMGFVEVLLNIRTILRNIKFCKTDILAYKPDVLILVDYPGFNLRIAKFAHDNGIKVFYYISPQIWAWKKSRVKKIKEYVDKMFVILPFEEDFYRSFNYKVDFVGHPLLDAIEPVLSRKKDKDTFLEKNSLQNKSIIALLPGSRKQEISSMLPVMIQIISFFKDYQFVIGASPSIPEEFYENIVKDSNAALVFDQTYDLLHNADAAIVTSGTATLETALFEVPEVVCYKGNFLSYSIAKRLINIKFIALPNLILDRRIVKELIQNHYNIKSLKAELEHLLFDDKRRTEVKEAYAELKNKLGGKGASEKAASLMVEYLEKDK